MKLAEKVMTTQEDRSPDPIQQSHTAMRAFHFPRGIAGFSEAIRFGFIYEGMGNMVCMQSLDCPEASFILTPWDESRLGQPPTLSAEQCACLQVKDADQVAWLLVLNPFADAAWVTANLRAPVVICEATQMGLQCIRNQASLDLRFQWMRQPV